MRLNLLAIDALRARHRLRLVLAMSPVDISQAVRSSLKP